MSKLLCSCAGRRRRRDRRRCSSSSSRTPTPTPRAQRRRAFPRDDVLRVPPGVEVYRGPAPPTAPPTAPSPPLPSAPLLPSAPEPPSSRSSSSADCSLPMASREKLAHSRETLPVGGDPAEAPGSAKGVGVDDVCCKGSGEVWVKMDPSSTSFQRRKTPNKQVAASVDQVWTKEGARRRLYGGSGAWSTEDFTNTQLVEGDDIWVKARPQQEQDVKNAEEGRLESSPAIAVGYSAPDSIPGSSSQGRKAKSVTLDHRTDSRLKSDSKDGSNSFLNWFWTLFRGKGKGSKKGNVIVVPVSTPSDDASGSQSESNTARENEKFLGEAARAVLTGSDFRLIDDDADHDVYEDACVSQSLDVERERRGSAAVSESIAKRLEDIDEVLRAVYERNVAYGRSISMQRLAVPASPGGQSEDTENFSSKEGDNRSVSCHSLVKSAEQTSTVHEAETSQQNHEKKISVGSSSPSSYYSHSRSESELTNDEEFWALGTAPPPPKGKPTQAGYLRLSEPSFTDAECAHYKVGRYLEQSNDAQWFGHSDQSLEGKAGKPLETKGAILKQDIKSDVMSSLVEEKVFQMATNFDEGVCAIKQNIEKCLTPPLHIPGAEETASFLTAERNWQQTPMLPNPPKVVVTKGDYSDGCLLGFSEEGLDEILAMTAATDVEADEWAGFDPAAWSREKGFDPAAVGTQLKDTSPSENWLHEVKQGEVLGTPSHESWSDIQRALQELVDSQGSALLQELKTVPENQAAMEPLLEESHYSAESDPITLDAKSCNDRHTSYYTSDQLCDNREAENTSFMNHPLKEDDSHYTQYETVSETRSSEIPLQHSRHFQSKQIPPHSDSHFVLEHDLQNTFRTQGNETECIPDEGQKDSGKQELNTLQSQTQFEQKGLPRKHLLRLEDSSELSQNVKSFSSVNVFTLSEETLNNLRSAAQNIEQSACENLISGDEKFSVESFNTPSVCSSVDHSSRQFSHADGEPEKHSVAIEEFVEAIPVTDREQSAQQMDYGPFVTYIEGISAQTAESTQNLEPQLSDQGKAEGTESNGSLYKQNEQKLGNVTDEERPQILGISNIKIEAAMPEAKLTEKLKDAVSTATSDFVDLSVGDNVGIVGKIKNNLTEKDLTEEDSVTGKYDWKQRHAERWSPTKHKSDLTDWPSAPLSPEEKIEGRSGDPLCDNIWKPSDSEMIHAAENKAFEEDLFPSLQHNPICKMNPESKYSQLPEETMKNFKSENIETMEFFRQGFLDNEMHGGGNFVESQTFMGQVSKNWFSAGSEVWDPFNVQMDTGRGTIQSKDDTETPWMPMESTKESFKTQTAPCPTEKTSPDTQQLYCSENSQQPTKIQEPNYSMEATVLQNEDSLRLAPNIEIPKGNEVGGHVVPDISPSPPTSPPEASTFVKSTEKAPDFLKTDERSHLPGSFEEEHNLKHSPLHAAGSHTIHNKPGLSEPFGGWEFMGFPGDELKSSDPWKLNVYSDFPVSDLSDTPSKDFGKDFTIIDMPLEDSMEKVSFSSDIGKSKVSEATGNSESQPDTKINDFLTCRFPEDKNETVLHASEPTISQVGKSMNIIQDNHGKLISDISSYSENAQKPLDQETSAPADNSQNNPVNIRTGELDGHQSYRQFFGNSTLLYKTGIPCDKTSEIIQPAIEEVNQTESSSDVPKSAVTKEPEHIPFQNLPSTSCVKLLPEESLTAVCSVSVPLMAETAPPSIDSVPLMAETAPPSIDSHLRITEAARTSPQLDQHPPDPCTIPSGSEVNRAANHPADITGKELLGLSRGIIEKHTTRKRRWSSEAEQFPTPQYSDTTEKATKIDEQVCATEKSVTSEDSLVETDSYSDDSVFLDDGEAADVLGQGGYILHPITKQLIRRSTSLSSEPLSPMNVSSDMCDRKKSTGEDFAENKGDGEHVNVESVTKDTDAIQNVEAKSPQTERKGSVVLEKMTTLRHQISEGIQHKKDSVYNTEKKLLEKMHSWIAPVEKLPEKVSSKITEDDILEVKVEEELMKAAANHLQSKAPTGEISIAVSGTGIIGEPDKTDKWKEALPTLGQLKNEVDVSGRGNSSVVLSEKPKEELSEAPKTIPTVSSNRLNMERDIVSGSPSNKTSPESRTTVVDIHWNPVEDTVGDLSGLEYETVIVDRDPLLGKEFTIVVKSSSDTENSSSQGSRAARRSKRLQSPCSDVDVMGSRSPEANRRPLSGRIDSEAGSHRSTDYSSSPVCSEDEYFLEDIPQQALQYGPQTPNPLIYEECESDEADVECGDSSRPATSSSDDWYFSSSRAVDGGLALSYGPPSNASSRLDLQPITEQVTSEHVAGQGAHFQEATPSETSADQKEVFTEEPHSSKDSPGNRSSVSCEGPDYYDIEMRIDNVLKRIDALQESDPVFCATEYVGGVNPFDFSKDEWMCLESSAPLERQDELVEKQAVEGCGSTVEEDQRFLEETYLNSGNKSRLQRVCTRQNLTKSENLETNPFVTDAEHHAAISTSTSISESDQQLRSHSGSSNPFLDSCMTLHGHTTGVSNPFLYTEAEIREQLRRAGFSSEEEIFPISPPGGTISEASSGVAGDRSCSPDSSSTDSSEGTLVQDPIAPLPFPNEELLLSPRNSDRGTLPLRKHEIHLECDPKKNKIYSKKIPDQVECIVGNRTSDAPKVSEAAEGYYIGVLGKYERQSEAESLSLCGKQPESQSHHERCNERLASLPDLVSKDVELTESSVSISVPNKTLMEANRDDPVLRQPHISSSIPSHVVNEQTDVGHKAFAGYVDLQGECVSSEIGVCSPSQDDSVPTNASCGGNDDGESTAKLSALPDLVGPTGGGSGESPTSPQAKRRDAATNETTSEAHQDMLGDRLPGGGFRQRPL